MADGTKIGFAVCAMTQVKRVTVVDEPAKPQPQIHLQLSLHALLFFRARWGFHILEDVTPPGAQLLETGPYK